MSGFLLPVTWEVKAAATSGFAGNAPEVTCKGLAGPTEVVLGTAWRVPEQL